MAAGEKEAFAWQEIRKHCFAPPFFVNVVERNNIAAHKGIEQFFIGFFDLGKLKGVRRPLCAVHGTNMR